MLDRSWEKIGKGRVDQKSEAMRKNICHPNLPRQRMVAPIEPSLLPSPTPLTPAKRPITSSAFSFTFSTPAPTRPRPLGTLASQSSFSPFRDDRKPPIPVRNATTKKIYTTLDVLPLPYSLDGTPQAGPSKPTHRLSDLLDEVSPFRPGNKPRGDGGDEKAMVRLGDIPGRRMTEDLGRRVKGVVEDEGLGVSPRRSRTGVRWTGKG